LRPETPRWSDISKDQTCFRLFDRGTTRALTSRGETFLQFYCKSMNAALGGSEHFQKMTFPSLRTACARTQHQRKPLWKEVSKMISAKFKWRLVCFFGWLPVFTWHRQAAR
jgi:hypothetical protein